MRLTDIFLFEDQELTEIDMSPGGLRRQAANINATVGIEFEMIVPGVKGGDDYAEPERDYNYNPRTSSIGDIEEFFNDGDYNSRRDVARLITELTEQYNEWQEEQFQNSWEVDKTEMIYEYVRYELDDDIIAELLGFNADNRPEGFTRAQIATVAEMIADDPENQWHDEAMDYARSDFYENTDMGEWLTEMGLERMSDVEGQFDITWPHWDIPADEEDVDVDSIGQDFSTAVGKKVNVSKSYHGGKREPDKYVVEPDGSLDPEGDDDVGLEFISPPLPLAEMMDQLKLVIAWAKNNNCYTNKSTGLHMNVSVPNFSRDQLDYVKLALLLGDEYILDSFGRSSNTYTKSAMMKVRDRVASQPADAEQLLQAMKGHLQNLASRALHSGNTDKYTSINTKDGYIEFRSPGGDWLNEDIGKLEATILRFVVALDAAMDPEKHRKEYLSKLRKLLTAGQKQNDDIIQHFVQYSSGTLPKQALKSFIRQAQLQRQITKKPTSGERYWWKVQIGPAAIEVVAKDNQEAWTVALKNEPLWTKYSIRQAEIVPLRPYKDETPNEPIVTVGQGRRWEMYREGSGEVVEIFTARDIEDAWNQAMRYMSLNDLDMADYNLRPVQESTPPPELNGRPSNPDGNVYIASQEDPDTPLYRFMAADSDDVRTVLNQWRNQYGSNYTYRIDHLQLRGQPGQAQTAEPIGRVRAAGPSQPAWRAPRAGEPQGQETIERLLGMADQTADANYEIVRRDNYQPVFLFIANTPQVASRVLERYLEILGLDQDSEEFGFRERARPGSTLDLQRQRAEQSARAAVQSTSGNRLWQIVDSADGEVAYEFYLSRENNQQDANEVGLRWVRNNGDPNTRYSVREQPQETGTVRPQNQEGSIQWRILVGGEEVHRFWNRINQGEANVAAGAWVRDQIRRGLLSPAEGADVEVVPVQGSER